MSEVSKFKVELTLMYAHMCIHVIVYVHPCDVYYKKKLTINHINSLFMLFWIKC